jgi:hypothetical protein
MGNADLAQGRSEALNKTIGEIMNFLGDNAKRPGGTGADLRGFLREKLGDLGEYWYKRGVRRGRIESYDEWKTTGKLSKRFRYKGTRQFFDGDQRSFRVTSTIKT